MSQAVPPAASVTAGRCCCIRWCISMSLCREQGSICRNGRATRTSSPGSGIHVDYGEAVVDALRREAREELGLRDIEPIALSPYVFESSRERELINPFYVYVDESTAIVPDPEEITEGRFWSAGEIDGSIGKGVFTPNFEQEYQLIKQYIK